MPYIKGDKKCAYCQQIFNAVRHINENNLYFCSKRCAGKYTGYKKGHHRKHTEEEKRKIGLANSIALKGKKLSKKHREAISKSSKGKNGGKNNGNYIHGQAKKPYGIGFTKFFRENIRQRDNHICQNPKCGKKQGKGRKFAIHHIDYDKNNHHLLNLITLCNCCHAKTTYTKKIIYYKKYYQKVMKIRFNDYNRASHVDEGIV